MKKMRLSYTVYYPLIVSMLFAIFWFLSLIFLFVNWNIAEFIYRIGPIPFLYSVLYGRKHLTSYILKVFGCSIILFNIIFLYTFIDYAWLTWPIASMLIYLGIYMEIYQKKTLKHRGFVFIPFLPLLSIFTIRHLYLITLPLIVLFIGIVFTSINKKYEPYRGD